MGEGSGPGPGRGDLGGTALNGSASVGNKAERPYPAKEVHKAGQRLLSPPQAFSPGGRTLQIQQMKLHLLTWHDVFEHFLDYHDLSELSKHPNNTVKCTSKQSSASEVFDFSGMPPLSSSSHRSGSGNFESASSNSVIACDAGHMCDSRNQHRTCGRGSRPFGSMSVPPVALFSSLPRPSLCTVRRIQNTKMHRRNLN